VLLFAGGLSGIANLNETLMWCLGDYAPQADQEGAAQLTG
jgi:hypothetical protein